MLLTDGKVEGGKPSSGGSLIRKNNLKTDNLSFMTLILLSLQRSRFASLSFFFDAKGAKKKETKKKHRRRVSPVATGGTRSLFGKSFARTLKIGCCANIANSAQARQHTPVSAQTLLISPLFKFFWYFSRKKKYEKFVIKDSYENNQHIRSGACGL